MRSQARTTESGTRSQALLLVGHGSHLSPDSGGPVRDHAARIRASGAVAEVREAYWKEEPSLRDALALVESDEVFVVPLFLAEGYFTERVVPRELAAGDPGRARVVLCPPVGTHPAMADLIERRAVEACGLPAEARRGAALVVIGHGTERSATSGDTVHRLVERLRERGAFGEVTCGFLDQSPRVEEVVESLPHDAVVLVPFFVAEGWHARTTIPRDLGLDGSRTERGDRRLWYTPPVGTLPEVTEVVTEIAREAGLRPGGPPPGEGSLAARARAELLRWVDGGGDPGRGFLQVRVRRTAGGRYEMRHEHDREAPAEALEPLRGPEALSALARTTAGGRYRPLRASPDLRRGWLARDLDGRGLWEALSALYPADAVHWHLRRAGDLPVLPFAATAARQSGIYSGVGALRGEALGRAVGECCGRGCLRAPLWAPVPPADDAGRSVPCPEACSVFVSFAREALRDGEEAASGLSTTPPARG